ncbi:MAG: DegV family protein [Clostridia bacterium]|jgi:DegV family protein with EDD domain|nr:DegV family protein [Clostridia bacterium]
MSFIIATDTPANLPESFIREHDIRVIPFTFYYDGEEHVCFNVDDFGVRSFYERMRNGLSVTTSQINPNTYDEFFSKILEEGQDLLYISMSSGISGSYLSSEAGAKLTREKYPDRKLYTLDTLGASLGEGLFVLKALEYRDRGDTIEEVYDRIMKERYCMYQIFTVDDLSYLQKTGRLSRAMAYIGKVLNIKPLLKGDREGKIVNFARVRGRKKVLNALAERYDSYVVDPEKQVIGIAHADCEEEALYLKELLYRNRPPKDCMLVDYEPVTGSHVGPGTIALFFESDSTVRDR